MTCFTLPLFIRKHEMTVYAQSGMEFHREKEDRREILHLGQFHDFDVISLFSHAGLILSSNFINFIRKRLQHRCFSVKFTKLLRWPSFTDSKKLIPDPLVTRKLIPKGIPGLLYTNIAQLMAHITIVYVAAYLAIMVFWYMAEGNWEPKGNIYHRKFIYK